MSSELLKKIAAGEAFDLVEGVREVARVLVEGPIEVSGNIRADGTVTAGSGIHGLAKDQADVPTTTAASSKKK